MTAPVSVRAATAADRTHVERLLRSEGLPLEGLAEHFEHFVVAEVAGPVIAAAGLEIHSRDGLLRSVVVTLDHRSTGVAQLLFRTIVENARRHRLAPEPGERWRFAGELRELSVDASRLEARLALPLAPRGRAIVRYLASNPRIAGVGRAYAQRLSDHFGEELYAVLGARDTEALTRVVGPILAANIVYGWGLYIDDVEAFAWLDACDRRPGLAVHPRAAVCVAELRKRPS